MGTGPVPIFRGVSGLNTVQDPTRLPYDRETGIMALAAAVNVVVDDTGAVSRRDGFTEAATGSWHSLFCNGGDCVGIKDGALCVIADDLTVTELRSGFTQRASFAQVNDEIYYVSGPLHGRVKGGAHLDWTAGEYVGPETNRTLTGPFPARHMAFYASRMWLAVDNLLVHSEPFGWSWFDLHGSSILTDSGIRMMKPVAGGMFVSTNTKTYFLAGRDPQEFMLNEVSPYPALEWSAATDLVDGLEIGLDEPGLCALWLSERGICAGSPRGFLFNLTRDKLIYPDTAPVGASLLRGYNLVHTMGV